MCICKQFHSKQGHLERIIISSHHSIPRFKKKHIDVINLEKTTPRLTCLHFRVLPRHLGRASLAISLHHIFAVTRESHTRGFALPFCFDCRLDWLQRSYTQNDIIVRNNGGHSPYCTGYFPCMIALSIVKFI